MSKRLQMQHWDIHHQPVQIKLQSSNQSFSFGHSEHRLVFITHFSWKLFSFIFFLFFYLRFNFMYLPLLVSGRVRNWFRFWGKSKSRSKSSTTHQHHHAEVEVEQKETPHFSFAPAYLTLHLSLLNPPQWAHHSTNPWNPRSCS